MAMHNIIDSYANAGSALHGAIKTLRTNIRFSRMDSDYYNNYYYYGGNKPGVKNSVRK